MQLLNYGLIAYTLLSLIGLFLMGADKFFAKKQRRRIPELHFMFLAAIGGALGILIGMSVFHHKLSKPKFFYGIPLLILVHWALLLLYTAVYINL